MKSEIAASMQAAKLMLVFTLLLGGGYTLIMTGLAQLFFPMQAAGSLHWSEDHTVLYGSRLMGQPFAADNHLWGRDMKLTADTFRAADETPLLYGTATNEAVKSEAFATRVAARTAYIRAAHPEMGDTPVPVDLVTVSGSGLDPDISPAAAAYQVRRLARTTGRSEAEIQDIIASCTQGRFLGIFGEPRVNVAEVNLRLDGKR